MSFRAAEGLTLLGTLARITAPPAGEREVCEQGLSLMVRALGARSGALYLGERGSCPALFCSKGEGDETEMALAAARAVSHGEPVYSRGRNGHPSRVAVPLPGDSGPVGALVFERSAAWKAGARSFAENAGRTLAGSLLAARKLRETRRQGEMLARRNVELETLRELTSVLQEERSEKVMLQAAIDLVLQKLGLSSGWIFWGDPDIERLQLAAHRGLTEDYVTRLASEGGGICLCREVFESGRSMLARNTTDCPRMREMISPDLEPSHACVPLKFERGTIGVMNIAARPGLSFSRQELQFLETVASQICLAVDKARTSRAETQRNAEARALASLTRAIGGSLDQHHILAAAGEYARELLRADRCAIFLGDGSRPPLFAYLAGTPLDGLTVGEPADLAALASRSPLAALRERRTLTIEDASGNPHANPDLARRWGTGSAIVVPLVAHDRLEGVLLASRSRPSRWEPGEVEIANALAGQAALAIETARLYQEAQDSLVRLQQAQYGMMRAERLAAVGTLASSLAHEVRNPLNSINLQLVLLSRRASGLDDPLQSQMSALIDAARHEILRLDALVEEFLSLSTIDRIALAEVSPAALVREVLDLMHPGARDRQIEIREEIMEDLPSCRLDREKIKQVLINLIRNALEAMSEGGVLTVSCQTNTARGLAITVADTGHGIEPGLDVFDFFMTTKRGGTGLGLPIARRIVEAHGGTLTYESVPDRGCVFRVNLNPPTTVGVQ